MSINLKEAVDFLLAYDYLYRHGSKLKVATKLYTDLDCPKLPNKAAVSVQDYVDFIKSCNIPERGEASNGGLYYMNRYSLPGAKGFKAAIDGGADLEDLIASTRLYYQSGIRSKVAIGRYMAEGLWRSDYEAYRMNKENNTTLDHVKEQTSNGTHTSWIVG